MGKRRLWFAISGVVILVSIVSLATRGLNLGIDFRGGVQITFKTSKPTSLTRRARADRRDRPAGRRRAGHAASRRTATSTRASRSASRSSRRQQQNKLRTSLTTKVNAVAPGVKNVSSSFGRQIARSAIIAVLFSLLVITLYIAVRFKGIAFAVPVIVALIHDVVITIGVYSVTGREVTESTVAAILTVLGYSIYDTIIIFDRIRENIPIMRRASFATIANVSLWETIRRSLATTFITLLPVARAVLLRRLDAQGLRVRPARRRHLGCLLVDLHRRAAADDLQGARAGIRAPEGQSLDRRVGRRADPRCRRRRRPRPSRPRRRRSTRSSTRWTATPMRSAKRAGSGASRGPMAVPDSTDREALDRVVTMLGPAPRRGPLAARRRHARAGAATRCAWGRGASAGCRMSRASSASSRARNGTSWSCGSRRSSTGCACSKTTATRSRPLLPCVSRNADGPRSREISSPPSDT